MVLGTTQLDVEWKLFLVVSETMERIGEITQARGRSFQLALDKPGGCDFNVPLDYDLFSEAKCVKHGVIAYRNKVPRFSGKIATLQENTTANSLQVSVNGWFDVLNRRIVRSEVGYPAFGAGSITAGEIIFANPIGSPGDPGYFPGGLLTIANAQRDTWIKPGVSTDKMQRILVWPKGQNIGAAISQLSEVEGGFDFWIDPLTRSMDITNWDEVNDKSDEVVFGYKWGPHNVRGAGRSFDSSTMANRYTANGKYGGGFAEDLAAQEEYQLCEEETQLSDVVDPNALLAYAGGEVLLRGEPRVIHSFEPFPFSESGDGAVPAPFDDFDIGDIVSLTAIKKPRINIKKQKMRVFGMNLSVSDEGNEKITALQVSP